MPQSKLETKLSEIVTTILVLAEEDHRSAAFRHRDWIIEQKEQARKQVEAERLEKERKLLEEERRLAQARIDQLLSHAADLQKADTIRTYVSNVRARLGTEAETGGIEAWANWALAEADRIDQRLQERCLKIGCTEFDSQRV